MYPHFLIIGAQKAGTTWLDRNLRTHPQIWLPPEKEIHFFDLPRPLPFAALRYAPYRSVRHWTRHRLRRDLAKVERGEQTADWYKRYYYLPRHWRWYRSLFTPGEGQICGEATPRYAVLSRRAIASVGRRMPQLKLIYLLRDPIDRMWSDLAMLHDQRFGGDGTHRVAASADSAFLKRLANLRHSRYAENLQRWESVLPAENIFIGFLEEINQQPATILRRIFTFLGVSPEHCSPDDLANRKINFADYPAIPHETARRLADALIQDTLQLHDRRPSPYIAAWLQRMDTLLSTPERKFCPPASA
jgi:hypothetical protein